MLKSDFLKRPSFNQYLSSLNKVKPVHYSWLMYNYCPLFQLQHLKQSYCILCALREQISDLVKQCSQRKLTHKFTLTRVRAKQCIRRREMSRNKQHKPLFLNSTKTSFSRIQPMIKMRNRIIVAKTNDLVCWEENSKNMKKNITSLA